MTDCKMNAGTLEAALQKAFELGGLEDGSYHLEAEEIEQVIRAAAPAVQGEPVAWLSLCIKGDQKGQAEIDEPHGKATNPEYWTDAFAVYKTLKHAEQPTISAYACTVPDDCETLHWRGQILSMNELVSVAQPAVDEEIHVHIEGRDVLTLPLASSGMSAPRFVVHVPAQQPAEQQPVYQRCEYCDGTGDVHSIDGEWRGACDCQQPAPDVSALVGALEEIVKQYPNPNISHQDFRVHACRHAETALAAHRKQRGDV